MYVKKHKIILTCVGTTNKNRRWGGQWKQGTRIYYGNISATIMTHNNPYYITGEWNEQKIKTNDK